MKNGCKKKWREAERDADFQSEKKIECLRDFLITAGILAAATGIGFGFYTLGFSEENIIIVYLLGAMIVAVLTASRVWSGLAALFSVLLFNYLFTVPRFLFRRMVPGIR